MKTITPGHEYELASLGGVKPQTIKFINKKPLANHIKRASGVMDAVRAFLDIDAGEPIRRLVVINGSPRCMAGVTGTISEVLRERGGAIPKITTVLIDDIKGCEPDAVLLVSEPGFTPPALAIPRVFRQMGRSSRSQPLSMDELLSKLVFLTGDDDLRKCEDEFFSSVLGVTSGGTTNEEVLAMLIDRMKHLQGLCACRENAIVITKLEEALMWIEKRTFDRKSRGVEGTLRT